MHIHIHIYIYICMCIVNDTGNAKAAWCKETP